MPFDNCFRHQTHSTAEPTAPYEFVEWPRRILPDSPLYNEQLISACEPWRQANVAHVLLVHGTFVGNDALGTLTELRRFAPGLSEKLRRISKGLVNFVMDETGNYTPRFARTFEQALSSAAGRAIPVELFNWSSQNNHIGRADGAVRLLDRLAQLAVKFSEADLVSPTPPRVMLWGHSHGGNVFALLTNLLAADQSARQAFFDAARTFFTPWLRKKCDMPAWERVERLLATDHPVRRLPLDVVAFGTPIRYGWDTGGYRNLLHFVNHRPVEGLPRYRTTSPIRPIKFLAAAYGDYIHQAGIAGSNLIPLPLAVRTLLADHRLDTALHADTNCIQLILKYRTGQRVHAEGTTLLVDYGDVSWRVWHHLAGHAVYTRREWLPFHIAEVARRFYRAPGVC